MSVRKMQEFIEQAHTEWRPLLTEALNDMNQAYLIQLKQLQDWLPGSSSIFSAFSQPLSCTRYVLLGESPYPRKASANGYAFWDAQVNELWQKSGLSRLVNRATSLRNFIKMLLHARGDLAVDFSQDAIAKLDKTHFVQSGHALFNALLHRGFLLLNASLVYGDKQVPYHARMWRPFVSSLFRQLAVCSPSLKLILFGRIAALMPEANLFETLKAEHPYNISFITNPDVLSFFKPMDLLRYHE